MQAETGIGGGEAFRLQKLRERVLEARNLHSCLRFSTSHYTSYDIVERKDGEKRCQLGAMTLSSGRSLTGFF